MLFDCLFLFIPATNLGDTKTICDEQETNLVLDKKISQVGSMCHTSQE
jgi:hypothetical protein